jgi:hypothetical protein
LRQRERRERPNQKQVSLCVCKTKKKKKKKKKRSWPKMYGEKVSQVRGAVYVIGRGTKGRVEVSNNKRNVVGMMNVERQQVPLKEYILFFIDDVARNKFCYIG